MWLRTSVGFLVAPISPGLLIGIPAVFFGKASEGLWIIKFSGLLGYPIAIILGIPLYLF
jgi:hypothetical protein